MAEIKREVKYEIVLSEAERDALVEDLQHLRDNSQLNAALLPLLFELEDLG